jgi:hypothetical protein
MVISRKHIAPMDTNTPLQIPVGTKVGRTVNVALANIREFAVDTTAKRKKLVAS